MSWARVRIASSKCETLRAFRRSTGLPRATIGRTVMSTAPSVFPRDCISRPRCSPSRSGDIEAVDLVVDPLDRQEQAGMVGIRVQRGEDRRGARADALLDQELLVPS